jgi:hypothetical protein
MHASHHSKREKPKTRQHHVAHHVHPAHELRRKRLRAIVQLDDSAPETLAGLEKLDADSRLVLIHRHLSALPVNLLSSERHSQARGGSDRFTTWCSLLHVYHVASNLKTGRSVHKSCRKAECTLTAASSPAARQHLAGVLMT